MYRLRAFTTSLVAGLLTTGCYSLGPRGIEASRIEFNRAIQRTDAEQLLLNIVRQRYNDPVMFLEVASISSALARTGNLSLSSLLSSNLTAQTFSSGLGGTGSESPIVFYSPNTGERFVRQMLTPLDLRTLSLLLQSGWSIERVLLVAGESINGIKNTSEKDSLYGKLVDNLRTLQRANLLSFALERKDNVDVLAIIPAPGSANNNAYITACDILRLPADGNPIRIKLGVAQNADDSSGVLLVTRSLFSSFYFLSSGVTPPAEDISRRVIQPRVSDGGLFDPSRGELFQVRTSRSEPAAAAVQIRYRDQWFYIAETDADTRTTFSLLSIMLMLQGGDASRVAPLISVSPAR